MRKINTRKQAKQDLKSIWLYSFKTWGERQADKYFDDLDKAMSIIAENPQIGSSCDFIKIGYRQYHINRHIIFYQMDETHIHIVRVLHDSMNFKNHI